LPSGIKLLGRGAELSRDGTMEADQSAGRNGSVTHGE
jgi:hypothetical protein